MIYDKKHDDLYNIYLSSFLTFFKRFIDNIDISYTNHNLKMLLIPFIF